MVAIGSELLNLNEFEVNEGPHHMTKGFENRKKAIGCSEQIATIGERESVRGKGNDVVLFWFGFRFGNLLWLKDG